MKVKMNDPIHGDIIQENQDRFPNFFDRKLGSGSRYREKRKENCRFWHPEVVEFVCRTEYTSLGTIQIAGH